MSPEDETLEQLRQRVAELEEQRQLLENEVADQRCQLKELDRLRLRVEQLEAMLLECCNDLESWIADHYPDHTMHYPSQKRRYERDMEIVRRARLFMNKEGDFGK